MQVVPLSPQFPGQLLADALRAQNLACRLPCGGRQSCGNCTVWVKGALSAITAEEGRLLARHSDAPPLPGFVLRLACFCALTGNAEWLQEPSAPEVAKASAAVPDYDGANPASYGVAIDIGTTTITLVLYSFQDKKCIATVHEMNAQSAFGADVLRRITAPHKELHDVLLAQLNRMLAQLPPVNITRVAATGNTTMLHLFAGLNPQGMGAFPFAPQSLFGEVVPANKYFPALSGTAELFLPPCISAFVGADITCGILASRLTGADNTLLVDVGTNGEMALFANGELTVCSVAAGPAFEGAELSMGMPALPSAVDRVWHEQGQLRWHVIGSEEPRGICGTGFISALRTALELQIIDDAGTILQSEESPYLLWQADDSLAIWLGGSNLVITQADIRKLQLVKSSIAAGIETLLSAAAIPPATLGTVWLGGGFGSYLNPEDAAAIGMIPRALAAVAKPAGNIALQGAAELLFNRSSMQQLCEIASFAQQLQLAANEQFQAAFVANLGFA